MQLCYHNVCEGVTEYGWNGSRMVWVKGKIGIMSYAWICVCASVTMKTVQGRG